MRYTNIDEFIQENREGLVAPFPIYFPQELLDVALNYLMKTPFMIDRWESSPRGTGVLSALKSGSIEWYRVPDLVFIWPSNNTYKIDFSQISAVQKRKIIHCMKKNKQRFTKYDDLVVLSNILRILGCNVGRLQHGFDNKVFANTSFPNMTTLNIQHRG